MKNYLTVIQITILISLSFFCLSCSNDDSPTEPKASAEFKGLESPYLICASRNPGGCGFDFEYKEATGGVNNMDSLSEGFIYDVFIKTIKGEKSDGNLGGAPYFKLNENVQAINYSSVDAACKGLTAFNNLTVSNIKSYTLSSDDSSFDPNSVPTGSTGKPKMGALLTEYEKLVIGQKWKAAANNDIADDEPIWIIKTPENKIVKLIVTDFPASPAPTATGYISVEWAFVE